MIKVNRCTSVRLPSIIRLLQNDRHSLFVDEKRTMANTYIPVQMEGTFLLECSWLANQILPLLEKLIIIMIIVLILSGTTTGKPAYYYVIYVS